MPVLHLGVIEQPYAEPGTEHAKPALTKKGRLHKGVSARLARELQGSVSGKPKETVGDVAEMLEERYHIMQGFFDMHGDEIAASMARSLADAFTTKAMSGSALGDPLADGMAEIGEMFREFLDREELAGRVEGVPTKAALAGVSHRFKHPYAKGHPRRPSFVDTGLFRASFLSWLDGGL